jgi:predicted Zn-dependent protease
MSGRLLGVAAVIAVLVAVISTPRRPRQPAPPAPDATAAFTGAAVCVSCHPREAARWQSSAHARAMQAPSRPNVVAPFNGETFSSRGVTTTFSRRGDTYVVRTAGPDGAVRDFDVAYTFGVYPLQQYLLGLPGGRLQALEVAWDARPAPVGQRWYQVSPASQNWNLLCADCHSTNVRKNYRAENGQYDTTWTDISVACEACHGAGSRHVTWARASTHGDDDGLTPVRRNSRAEIEMCARCHSRRAQLTDDVDVGRPLADSYRPFLLDEGLYFADGQIDGEVHEYGSFLQSRMYTAGVSCTDCHDAHEPGLRSRPDEICSRCHAPRQFATPAHHHHTNTSPGGSCVSCHMSARASMAIAVRRDHSFRIPRPDLTTKIGTPNSCTSCHSNRPASWATQAMSRWFGTARASQAHFGEALAAGRLAAVGAEPRLLAVVDDAAQPAIARATALSLLARWIDPGAEEALERAVHDLDALVRIAAVDALRRMPERTRSLVLTPLLLDPIRAVRIEASRALGANLAEWTAVQRFNADTAGAHVNLGSLYAEHGDTAFARQEYETAQRLEPDFAAAAVQLADLYCAGHRDDEGERVLREALARTPDVPALHESLGRLLMRRHDPTAAIGELRRAAELAPHDPDLASALRAAR